MAGTNGRKALHVAIFSGWYRFEQDGKQFRQTKRDLTYWTLTCMSVDPDNPEKIYAGSEHSGAFLYEERRQKLAARRAQYPEDDAFLGLGAQRRRDGGHNPIGGFPQ